MRHISSSLLMKWKYSGAKTQSMCEIQSY
jgi:hypothetical protein